MTNALLLILILLLLIFAGLIVYALRRMSAPASDIEKYFARVQEELSRGRDESGRSARESREELNKSLTNLLQSFSASVKAVSGTNEENLGKIRSTLESKLEQVHKGLGEMQSLAVGIGDLKKTLTNVKTQGILGEVQLENILRQILAPGQYEKNVATKKGSSEVVEFAVKLPGRDTTVWLPLDAKFPLMDYSDLLKAYDSGSADRISEAQKTLERKIKEFAKDIRDKYLDPPNTTDLAVMFLPVEGLFAEVVRSGELFETLHRDYKVMVTGPTTLAAYLHMILVGFRTVAIEQRAGEIYSMLGAVRTEFGKFSEILESAGKKLEEAQNKLDSAATRSRAIEKKLGKVDALPAEESARMLRDNNE